jgi:2-polyprenyl-3-methyl-5-hydroxy-6-metoxy-1,4-benzoquinol methylase
MSDYHKKYFKWDRNRDNIWQEIVNYLGQYFPKEKKSVLELGAGYCSLINSLDFKYKAAIDSWKEFPHYAYKDVECFVHDVRKNLTKIFTRKFNLMIASNLLEHLSMNEGKKLIIDCRSLLKPGGRLVLIQPNYALSFRHYFDDYTHQTIYTDKSLRHMVMEQNFKVIHVEPRFLPFTFQSRWPKSKLLVKTYLAFPIRPFAGQMLLVAERQ